MYPHIPGPKRLELLEQRELLAIPDYLVVLNSHPMPHFTRVETGSENLSRLLKATQQLMAKLGFEPYTLFLPFSMFP